MTEYLIAFNGDWVPEHTEEELLAKVHVLRPLIAEMKAAGVLIFTGDSFSFGITTEENRLAIA